MNTKAQELAAQRYPYSPTYSGLASLAIDKTLTDSKRNAFERGFAACEALSLDGMAVEHTHFTLSTFIEATAASSLIKLTGEIREVMAELENYSSDEKLAEEFADCLKCIFDSAARAGLTVEQLNAAFAAKLKKNKARTWVKNPDNTYSHVKDAI